MLASGGSGLVLLCGEAVGACSLFLVVLVTEGFVRELGFVLVCSGCEGFCCDGFLALGLLFVH